jgi:DNA-binding LacI/PurR family transcriptional regulator
MKQSILTYETIKDALRARVSNEWEPGTRLPPVKDLAREMGLGQSNTHRAIKALADEGLLVCRPRIGTFVARTPSGPLTGRRVIVLRANDEPMLDAAVDAIVEDLEELGAQVSPEMQRSHQMLDDCTDYDAIVLVNSAIGEHVRAPAGQLLVIVTTGVDYDPDVGEHYDFVSVDSEQGGVLAGNLARQVDCRSACFVGSSCSEDPTRFGLTSELRLRGFLRGWGRPVEACQQIRAARYIAAEGAKAFAEFHALTPRPELVFAASDDLAVGFVHGGLAHGARPGVDYQLIGFDGQACGGQVDGGPLTTIKVPMSDMGHTAARMLRERFENPQQPVRRIFLSGTLQTGATARQSVAV